MAEPTGHHLARHLRELASALVEGFQVADDDIDPLLHDMTADLAAGLEGMMLEGDLEGLMELVLDLAEDARSAGAEPAQ